MNECSVLMKALDSGLIDYTTIQAQIEYMERANYLDSHTSIWQGKNGKWYTKVSDESNTRRLIKRNSREEIEEYVVGFYTKQSKPTIQKVYNEWITEKVRFGEICRGTVDRYNNAFIQFFGDIKDYPIEDVTEDDLEYFVKATIADKKLSAKAYGNMRIIIRGMFKYAKKRKYTNLSISEFFGDLDLSRKIFTRTRKSNESQVFNETEIKTLMKWLMEHPSVEHYGIILAFQTGIREGELSALKYSDVKDGKLYISRQEVRYKADVKGKVIHDIVDYTKTDAGERIIFLPKCAINTISKIKELNPDNEFMMMRGSRKFYTTTFNHRLYKACDECGIPRKSMHKIRKTYGTILIDSGTDDGLIKQQMGHSNIETTRKYYYYSVKDEYKKVAQIENALKEVTPELFEVTPISLVK